jgi:hypothetical protein
LVLVLVENLGFECALFHLILLLYADVLLSFLGISGVFWAAFIESGGMIAFSVSIAQVTTIWIIIYTSISDIAILFTLPQFFSYEFRQWINYWISGTLLLFRCLYFFLNGLNTIFRLFLQFSIFLIDLNLIFWTFIIINLCTCIHIFSWEIMNKSYTLIQIIGLFWFIKCTMCMLINQTIIFKLLLRL